MKFSQNDPSGLKNTPKMFASILKDTKAFVYKHYNSLTVVVKCGRGSSVTQFLLVIRYTV